MSNEMILTVTGTADKGTIGLWWCSTCYKHSLGENATHCVHCQAPLWKWNTVIVETIDETNYTGDTRWEELARDMWKTHKRWQQFQMDAESLAIQRMCD